MKLSVIVPVHNERGNIEPFYRRAVPTLQSLVDPMDWEMVFVNNGSDDDTLGEILKIRAVDPRVKVITLSKNFGYHAALVAGLSSTEGDLYTMIDVDCEDPPELLGKFYETIRAGAQLVYGHQVVRRAVGQLVFLVAFPDFLEHNRPPCDELLRMLLLRSLPPVAPRPAVPPARGPGRRRGSPAAHRVR